MILELHNNKIFNCMSQRKIVLKLLTAFPLVATTTVAFRKVSTQGTNTMNKFFWTTSFSDVVIIRKIYFSPPGCSLSPKRPRSHAGSLLRPCRTLSQPRRMSPKPPRIILVRLSPGNTNHRGALTTSPSTTLPLPLDGEPQSSKPPQQGGGATQPPQTTPPKRQTPEAAPPLEGSSSAEPGRPRPPIQSARKRGVG